MDIRHPVQSLEWALMQATERDLAGIESNVASALLARDGGVVTCRPRPADCGVVLFVQSWRASDLGLVKGRSAAAAVEAETVIITGPCGDACVYVSRTLLYHLSRPNRRFFLDVAAQQLRGVEDAANYEGRDTADLEALDFEVAGALARLRGAAVHGSADDAARIARQLEQFAGEIRKAARLNQSVSPDASALPSMGAPA